MDEKYISKSKLLEDGVCVWFGNSRDDESYYAHAINRIGKQNDKDADDTMWGWINHMRHKLWWNPGFEQDFIDEVHKHIPV